MKIQQLISDQRDRGHIILIKQGLFFRGYNEGAVLLYNIMKYTPKSKEIRSCGGNVCYCGFPANVTNKVLNALIEHGAKLIIQTENLLELSVVDFNSLEVQVQPLLCSPQVNLTRTYDDIITQLREYRLDCTTPMESINLIHKLKNEILAIDNK